LQRKLREKSISSTAPPPTKKILRLCICKKHAESTPQTSQLRFLSTSGVRQRCTGSGFQDASPAGVSTFQLARSDPGYGFIRVSGSWSSFSNFSFWYL